MFFVTAYCCYVITIIKGFYGANPLDSYSFYRMLRKSYVYRKKC